MSGVINVCTWNAREYTTGYNYTDAFMKMYTWLFTSQPTVYLGCFSVCVFADDRCKIAFNVIDHYYVEYSFLL